MACRPLRLLFLALLLTAAKHGATIPRRFPDLVCYAVPRRLEGEQSQHACVASGRPWSVTPDRRPEAKCVKACLSAHRPPHHQQGPLLAGLQSTVMGLQSAQ